MDDSVKNETLESQWLNHVDFAKWLVKLKDPKLTIDLGTFQGVSAIALAAENNGRVVTIDINQPKKYNDIIKKVTPNVEILKGRFDKYVDDFEDHSVDILHIDGDHKMESVTNDVLKWTPKLKEDGVLLMHDIWNPAFYGPLKIFVEAIKAYKLAFIEGAGLGVSSMDKDLMAEIYQVFPSQIVVERLFNSLLTYSERKNVWIKGLSVSFARERVQDALKEKTDLLSATRLSE